MFIDLLGKMSQIDNLLNFVAGNSENRKVMSSVDDGWGYLFESEIDVFSWLLINSDLFTLNNDQPLPNSQQSSKEPASSLNPLKASQTVDRIYIVIIVIGTTTIV